ncbi:MAG: TetR/AcrR family transcriptional regulator [Arachidicoccus sp.]|nr:TetR/AcrR family transcriptional regulator [Arachidicoccus sp.]
MGITERKIRHKKNLKVAILETAWNIVKEEGWEALSIRKIADAIEYSVPVIYSHFENKEAILSEISLEGFRHLQNLLTKAGKKYTDPKDQLKAYAETYWNFAFRNKEYYMLMFGLGMPSCCTSGKPPEEIFAFKNCIAGAVEKIMKSRNSNMDDFHFKKFAFWSVLHGLISIRFMRNNDIGDTMNKKVMEDTVASFLKNL